MKSIKYGFNLVKFKRERKKYTHYEVCTKNKLTSQIQTRKEKREIQRESEKYYSKSFYHLCQFFAI